MNWWSWMHNRTEKEQEEKMGQKCMPNNTPTIISEKCALATNSQRVFVVTLFYTHALVAKTVASSQLQHPWSIHLSRDWMTMLLWTIAYELISHYDSAAHIVIGWVTLPRLDIGWSLSRASVSHCSSIVDIRLERERETIEFFMVPRLVIRHLVMEEEVGYRTRQSTPLRNELKISHTVQSRAGLVLHPITKNIIIIIRKTNTRQSVFFCASLRTSRHIIMDKTRVKNAIFGILTLLTITACGWDMGAIPDWLTESSPLSLGRVTPWKKN